jgi:hypothetical protein
MTGPITESVAKEVTCTGTYSISADIASGGSESIALTKRDLGATHWQPLKDTSGTAVALVAGNAIAQVKLATGQEIMATRTGGSAVGIKCHLLKD